MEAKEFLGLTLSGLKAGDIFILILLCLLLFFPILFLHEQRYDTTWVIINSIGYFFPWFISIRFKNIMFSVLWLCTISVYYYFSTSLGAILPILSFAYYHILRLIFWINYKSYFVPSGYSRYTGFFQYTKGYRTVPSEEVKIFTFLLYMGGIVLYGLFALS